MRPSASNPHSNPSPDRRTVLRGGLGATTIALVGANGIAPAHADTVDLPWVIDCDGWGARPPANPLSHSAIRTNKIIVHHMAFPNVDDFSREQAVKLAQDCQNLHMDTFGWSDTGQNFTISRGGYVLEGRRGSLESLETGGPQMISAHCPGENGRAIGIENEGTYITELPTRHQWASLVRLCVAICRQYDLQPYDIFGHWDYRDTECPGIAFYKEFPRLRTMVALVLRTDPRRIPRRRWPDIWRFVNGYGVRVAQYLLIENGYDLVPDGAFGPLTTAAVQDWQSRNGIPVDVDATLTPPTWESLAPRRSRHDSGPAVTGLQEILARKGYAVTATGEFDYATHRAAKELQRLHGLRVTGTVDTATWCVAVGGIVREAFKLF